MKKKTRNYTAPTVTVKKVSERLPCQLSDAERLDFADELAEATQQVDTISTTRKSQMQQINSELRQAEARRDKLSGIVGSKTEYRDITVEVKHDYDRGFVIKTRTDTGEVILERRMTDDERQVPLIEDGEQFNAD